MRMAANCSSAWKRPPPKGSFRWQGFERPEDANAHLHLFETLFPLGEDFSYEFLRRPDERGLMLHVGVRKTRAIIKAADGLPHLRRGATNLTVSSAEGLKQLERAKGLASFEDETVSVALGEVTNSEVVLTFMLAVIPTAEPEQWLRKQQLIRETKPTVAGVMLFAELPQAHLPKRSGVKIYRYKTSQPQGSRDTLVGDPETIEGCLYDVIKQAVRRTQEIITSIQVLGADGLEAITYPPETLHEIITNALIHRDYAIADDVHIRVFDNRVEVESPGRLPAHITPANILQERFARNGNLVRVINKFPDPPNKDVGEGLNTAFDETRKLKLKDPVIEERDHSVVVHVRHERLASAEELVLQHLLQEEQITNGKGRELTGIDSENAMKNVFYRLRDRGLIEQVPGLRGSKSAWRLTDKGRRDLKKS
jgi:ATP-dependent DNA helicase RecG